MAIQKRDTAAGVRYVARYRGPDQKERSRTFTRRKDAKVWLEERERDLRRGEWIDPKEHSTTLASHWKGWERAATSEGTRKVRERVGRNLGHLEQMPLWSIRPSDIERWAAELEHGRTWAKKAKLAPNTRKAWIGQLSGALNMAVRDGILVASPMAKADVRVSRTLRIAERDLPTVEQIAALAEARPGTFARMVTVAAATGLRAGELGGLRVESVDFLRKQIHVTEQATLSAAMEWQPLKSERSRRVVPLPDVAARAMSDELAANPGDRSQPVFRTAKGQMWHSGTIAATMRVLNPGFTFHGLRHFYASTLIHSGASVVSVSELLGHASPQTTLEIYGHMWPGESERLRGIVDETLTSCGLFAGFEVGRHDEAPAATGANGG